MLSINDQKEAARNKVIAAVPIAVEPMLEDQEIEAILVDVQRATVWVAATVFEYGDVIYPTSRNGHVYKAVIGGTSSTTEPTWPTRDGSGVADGSTLRWQEVGRDYGNVFDIPRAINRAWHLKMGKASELMSRKTTGTTFEEQQVFEHCEKMWKSTIPPIVA